MRKLFLVAAMAFFGTLAVNAQEFKIGINGALPVGDISESYSFAVNADLAYLFEVSDVFHVGPAVSVFHYFGEDIDLGGFGSFEIEDATFVPVGVTGRFSATESFILGADIGYGIGIAPEGNDGGFYYKPQAMYMVSENFGVKLSFAGISVTGGTFSSVNLGVEFGL